MTEEVPSRRKRDAAEGDVVPQRRGSSGASTSRRVPRPARNKDSVPLKRSRLPRAKRVEDIESAARLVFARRGFAAASMAEIAAEAGVAEGTIYKFFASKRHLVLRVIERWYEAMVAEFERSLPGISGARNKIRYIIWRHITSLKEDRDLARLCGNEARNAGDYYQSELQELNRRYTHIFLEACREGVATGELRSDIPLPLLRDIVFGGIEHHVSHILYGKGNADGKRDVDANVSTEFFMSMFFDGADARASGRQLSVAELLQRLESIVSRCEAATSRSRTV